MLGAQVSWWVPADAARWPGLLLTAALIAAVSLLEAISIAKSLAEVAGDTINANQELLGARAFVPTARTACLFLGFNPTSG